MWTEWIGRDLGRYHIERLIGQGAMGVVFQARDPELDRPVAVKILYPNLVSDSELVERFRLEARTAANLHHRNIVAIYDVGYSQDLYYFVMEYLEGRPLSQIIAEQGALPNPQVLDICGQIASALDYIHQRKLVHRDVKSSNIIVDPDGRAVLTDFGLALTSKGSSLTAEGKIIGTPQYIAPEQIAGGEVGGWTDLYALGVVAYEMLTSQSPYDAEVPAVLLFQVLWQAPQPLTILRTDLPQAVDEVIRRALSKDPRERYPSGSSFVTALAQALDGQSVHPAVVVRPEIAQPGRFPRILGPAVWLRSAGLALVFLLAISGVVLVGVQLARPATLVTPSPGGAVALQEHTPTPTPSPRPLPPTRATVAAVPPTHTSVPRPTPAPTSPLPTPSPQPTLPTSSPPPTMPTPSALPTAPTAPPTTAPPAATAGPPTATRRPPTATPVLPTATPPPPTATPRPPTATPLPPTATPLPPTATPLPPTATPLPPTATPIIVPTLPPPTPTPIIVPTLPPPTHTPGGGK